MFGASYKRGKFFYYEIGARYNYREYDLTPLGSDPAPASSGVDEYLSISSLDVPLTGGINVTSFVDRKETAYARTIIKVGEERVEALKDRWASMKTGIHGRKGDIDIADGVIVYLKQLNLSNVMIQSFIPSGGP